MNYFSDILYLILFDLRRKVFILKKLTMSRLHEVICACVMRRILKLIEVFRI